MKKLTSKDFLVKHDRIEKKIEKFKHEVNKKEYTPLHNKFILDNCSLSIGAVYEARVCKRRYKRFVIYDLRVRILAGRFVTIEAGGWWLDENDDPKFWGSETVFGVLNPTIFTRSANQKNNKLKKIEIMAKLSLVPNKRTLIRGYFLDTINELNKEILDATIDQRTYSANGVKLRLEAIKGKFLKELDKLTEDME